MMTDPTPIRDIRTCREKQDAAIAKLQEQADLQEWVITTALTELKALRARVAALEAAPSTLTYDVSTAHDDAIDDDPRVIDARELGY